MSGDPLHVTLILLAVAVLVTGVFHSVHLPSILGYLVMGVLLPLLNGLWYTTNGSMTSLPVSSSLLSLYLFSPAPVTNLPSSVISVIRNGIHIPDPVADIPLREGDVLVLSGESAALEMAQRRLHSG